MSSDSPKSLFAVDGMVALVTGGATGIGLMLVKALVENGAEKVYIIGRRKEVLEQAQATLGSKVEILVGDVAKKEDLVAAAEVVKSQVGYLNLLICNAGVAGPKVPGPAPGTTVDEWAARNLEIPTEDFTKTFDINTTAAWYTTMAFLTLLDAGNKKGNLIQSSQVITTSSIGAFNKTAPGGWAYGMSKAAVTHLTKMLAIFLPAWNIRVNSIVPGLFPSEMSAAIVSATSADNSVSTAMVPLGRMGDSEDMGGTLLYLASRAGAYCNGSHIIVDGGRLGTFPSTF